MKEEFITNKENEHFTILDSLYSNIDINSINNILDCGSGKTSLSSLLSYFKDSTVDAIVYYNDIRKINSIKDNVISNRFSIIERDICKDTIDKNYDLVLAHLLLGEATTWGNSYSDLVDRLLLIKTKYLIIVDFLEDNSVDYKVLEDKSSKAGYDIVMKTTVNKNEPQVFDSFIGKTYIGYLLIKHS